VYPRPGFDAPPASEPEPDVPVSPQQLQAEVALGGAFERFDSAEDFQARLAKFRKPTHRSEEN
jgi:hypothetical protein